ncbi:MAG: Rieske 2Fe-2S domain-containing protein, partial [Pseudomonadota bacterium]
MPNRYDDPAAIEALVREADVHRDVYISPDVFELEQRHLFRNCWMYLGHASQVPEPGDYLTETIAGQPLLMVRGEDRVVRVFHNRCPHKGTRLTAEPCGHAGRHFRCPYHAWTFDLDGALHSIPLKKGYEDTGFEGSDAERGLTPVAAMHEHREFVFVRLNEEGLSFEEFFGESLSSIDNMVDRSPEGRLVCDGAPLRYLHKCNWKMLVDNQTDTCHPMVAHESSAGTAVKVWERESARTGDAAKPMAVQVYAPFMAPYEFFERMGMRTWPNGHGHT